jgi:putative ABC transport system ATP-binding protein
MHQPLIETVGLSKQFRVGAEIITALRDFTVRIDQGEFVAIMGPSGSGKSTCMHLLGCLQSPSTGIYRFDGAAVADLSPKRLAETRNAKIGFVFQSFHLLPRATAVGNVGLPLIYGSARRRERRRLVELALEAVGLAGRDRHRPSQLSGGEMQRVAIARALVNRPRLLLADEPTGALDSQTGSDILDLLQRLNAEGLTIVIVTHDAEVAGRARRVLRFRDGTCVADEVCR